MTLPARSVTAVRGQAAASHGRSLLEDALGGSEEVQEAACGRRTPGTGRPAGRSPNRQATLPEELDRRGSAFIEARDGHDHSALVRTAPTEHPNQHASA